MSGNEGLGRRRAGAVAAALLVVGMAGWWATRPSQETPHGETTRVAPAAPVGPEARAARVATVDRGLQALEAAERAASRSRWDPGYVVGEVGRDPEALRRWVGRNTYWVPYRGVLRGARGVLMDRQGNSLDRALLLTALLAASGHESRLARGTIPRDEAARLLPALISRRARTAAPAPAATMDPEVELRRAAAGPGLDEPVVARSINPSAERMRKAMRTLETRTTEQSARLLELVQRRARGVPWRERVDSAVEVLRDHWWVQVMQDGEWVDLDPDAAGAEDSPRLAPTEATLEPEALDSSLHHRTVIRLVAERWTGTGLRETVVLDHALRAVDSIGRSLELRILPEHWPPSHGGDRDGFSQSVRTAALEQTEWRATLLAGGQPVADVLLKESGATAAAPTGNPFGGLGRGIENAVGAKRADGVLTAAWLEYEIHTPDRAPEVIRRTLFDLVGGAARTAGVRQAPALDESARLRRSLALIRSTEILPLSCAMSPEFVLHLTAESVLRNRDLLRSAALGTLGGQDPSSVASPIPLPSHLYTLALARFESKDTADVYLARPNILTRHTFLVVTPAGFRVREATDIVANEVAVDLAEEDGFGAQVRQGVRDTNAEALLPREGASFNSVAEAFVRPQGWAVIGAAAGQAPPGLPRDAGRLIASEAEAGLLVVAPSRPVRLSDEEFVGWWRIDPRTGHTLGVAENGWGQSMVERAAIAIVATFWFEYLICEGAFIWGQSQQAFAPPFPLSLATPLAAMEREPCSVDALVSALVAAGVEIVAVTWPLVVRFVAGRGYSGILSERPWFATGDGDPGDVPPIFGNRPGGAPPDPDCPQGGGAAPSQRPSSEPSPAEPEPGPEAPGARGSEPPAGETEGPGKPAPDPDVMPHYPNDGEGIRSVPPENVEARIKATKEHANNVEQALDEALANYGKAKSDFEQAEAAFERAKARDSELQRYKPGSDEANQAYEEWLATSREARAKKEVLDQAERLLRRAQYQVDAARYQVGYLNRLAEANRKAWAAAIESDAATDGWVRTGMTNYDSPEYARWRTAREQYRQAQRELANAFWDKQAAPGGTDNTVPAPTEPAATEPAPAAPPASPPPAPAEPNPPSPNNTPAGGACPASPPLSPAAQSVGGMVAAGAGVGATP